MSEESDASGSALSPARGITGLIAANITLIVAVMVYMGWAYETSYYGYFHLNPLDLGISVQDYLFVSLNLFKPVVVVAVVVIISAIGVGIRSAALARDAVTMVSKAAALVRTSLRLRWPDRKPRHGMMNHRSDQKQPWRKPPVIMASLGGAMTVAALVLYGIAGRVAVSTYLVLALLAFGPLLLTWALRGNRRGRLSYSLAIVVLIVCALWAGSLYASGLGSSAARDLAASLLTKTEVAVDSVQSLALSGPGVSVEKLPAGYEYHYRYEGLRLLYMSSGTYYLLPAGWNPQLPLTFILDAGDETSVELY